MPQVHFDIKPSAHLVLPSPTDEPYLYKMMPASLVPKILEKGLSFSNAKTFFDRDEFLAKRKSVEPHTYLRQVVPTLLCDIGGERAARRAQELMVNPFALAETVAYLNDKKEPLLRLQEMLQEHYYVCSLTTDSNLNFQWTDYDEGKPQAQLVLDTEGVLLTFSTWVFHVHYSKEPVRTNECEISNVLLDILYSKHERYKDEKEVRVIFYDKALEVDRRIMVSVKRETLQDGRKFLYARALHTFLRAIKLQRGCTKEQQDEIETELYREQALEPQICLCEDFLQLKEKCKEGEKFNGKILYHGLVSEGKMSEHEKDIVSQRLLIDELSMRHAYDDVNKIIAILQKENRVNARVRQLLKRSRYMHVKFIRS